LDIASRDVVTPFNEVTENSFKVNYFVITIFGAKTNLKGEKFKSLSHHIAHTHLRTHLHARTHLHTHTHLQTHAQISPLPEIRPSGINKQKLLFGAKPRGCFNGFYFIIYCLKSPSQNL